MADGELWRKSFITNFGDEVGDSLEELGKEYEDMMTNFEYQKSRLRDYVPDAQPIGEDNQSASPTSSTSSSREHKKGFKGALTSAGIHLKRKLSKSGPSTSQRKSPLIRRRDKASVSSYSKSDTSSHDGEVFVAHAKQETVKDNNTNNSYQQTGLICCTAPRHNTSITSYDDRCQDLLHKPPKPHTRHASDDHVLIPPVLVDGELKRDYQYLSPRRQACYEHTDKKNRNRLYRSNSVVKKIGICEIANMKKSKVKINEVSPLKALYNATVLTRHEPNDKENYESSYYTKHGYSLLHRRCST